MCNDKKPHTCLDCKAEISKTANKCYKCGAFQKHPRRLFHLYFPHFVSVITILIIILQLLTFEKTFYKSIGPSLHYAYFGKEKKSSNEYTICIYISNSGNVSGYIDSA